MSGTQDRTARLRADTDAILPVLRANPGKVTSEAAAKATGLELERTRWVLKQAQKAGKVLCIKGVKIIAWVAAEHVAAVKLAVERDRAKRKRERMTQRNMRQAAQRTERAKEQGRYGQPTALEKLVAVVGTGATAKDVAARMGLSIGYVKNVLKEARRAGLLESKPGKKGIWGPPSVAPQPEPKDDDPGFTHRHACPRSPLPFVCTAPASVFHLGGML